jgi:hypothetical protein
MRIKRLQLSAAPGTIPDRGRLGGVIQASQRGRGAASAAEAPNCWAAEGRIKARAIAVAPAPTWGSR